MPRADELAAVQLALAQRPTVVRADVLDGIELAVQVDYDNLDTVHFDDLLRTRGNIIGVGDFHIFGHASSVGDEETSR